MSLITSISSKTFASIRFIASSSPTQAPAPTVIPALGTLTHYKIPTVPLIDTVFDIITIVLILCFLVFSLISVFFILHLRIKSRHFFKLQRFSTHWGPRFLLVVFISLWAINEFFRLPIFRKSFVFPFLPSLPLTHQTQFCKFHVILSFGLYEPGFLVVLLFLVNISIKKRSPGNLWATGFVASICLPLVIALYMAVNISPGRLFLPAVFYRSTALLKDKDTMARIVYCTYPLFGTLIFATFCVVYALALLTTYWKAVVLVINKRLKARINMLVWTVLVCLMTQVLLLTVSAFWDPENVWYYLFVLLNFVSVLTCGVVVEGILVIMPISDSLDVASDQLEETRGCMDEPV